MGVSVSPSTTQQGKVIGLSCLTQGVFNLELLLFGAGLQFVVGDQPVCCVVITTVTE